MKHARQAVAAALFAATFGAGAATPPASLGSHYSDLWWNPAESGWGMNVVQQGETAFVTLFVYGPDGKPTWYVAPDARQFAMDASGNPAFAGTLYKTGGPWLGGAFDPAKVDRQAVGQLVIEPRPDAKLYLGYTAEGVSVSKELVRQTFAVPDVAATYHATLRLRQAVPGSAPYGTRDIAGDVLVHLDGESVFLRIEEPAGRCEYRGTRTPSGKFAVLSGAYSCSAGDMGTFEITEFEVTQHAISGYLKTYSPTVNQYGRFAAARF